MKSIISFLQNAPEDLKNLLWLLVAGAGGVIAYLYINKEKQRKEADDRYDKLLSQFNNYKDKTVDERVEMAEKMIVAVNAFKQGLDEVPEKVVSKSLESCRVNLEKLIIKERDGKT